jgi:peroxiredoxin Q/BCP
MEKNIKLTEGDKAPDFSTQIAEDTIITLKELKGKFVVLYFYPKDSTPGCTLEARDFNASLSEFKDLNAEIIGISKDDLNSHDKFRSKHKLEFSIGSDIDGKICMDYGVWGEKSMFGKKYMGISRATFLISPEGNIVHIWPKVKILGHAKEVINKLRELQ